MESSSRVFKFSANKLQQLHMKAEDLWRVPAKQGWQKSPVSPMDVLKLFKGIKIKDGFELIAYIFRKGLNGNGVVWAVPEGYFPEVDECERLDEFLNPPKPDNAISPMHVIEGDGSPESYIHTSIFIREMWEFGALWHGLSWGLHEIIDYEPEGFEWHEKVDLDLQPKVIMGEKIKVEFFTLCEFIERAVYRHEDIFEGYVFDSRRELIATGGRGYVL